MLHINYEFLLELIRMNNEANLKKILDFGCGRGEVVKQAYLEGIDIYGADTFDHGVQARLLTEIQHLLNTRISIIMDGVLDYQDNYFDLIVSNQVFEHIEDLNFSLTELLRVMKPGGKLIALFPPKNVIREGHNGIPFSHWFSKGSKLRYLYTTLIRGLGFGVDFEEKGITTKDWVQKSLIYLDENTFYRPKREIYCLMNKYFVWKHIEDEYLKFRIFHMKGTAGKLFKIFLKYKFFLVIISAMFRGLSGYVIYAEPNKK